MTSASARRFRPFIWFLIISFVLSSTPHIELLFPCAAGLLTSPAYAAESAQDTDGDEAPNPPPPLPATDIPPPAPSPEKEPPKIPPGDALTSGFGPRSAAFDRVNVAGIEASPPEASLFSGALGFSIPIEVPPGRKGMAPRVALVYNSYQPNGWIGVGWTLDMGSIQRSTRKGLETSDSAYSGNEFVAYINGAASDLAQRFDWDSTGNTFGAKIESNLTRYQRASGGWTVTTKDGTKYYYGTSLSSRQDNALGTFKWCLEKVQDTNGNYMTLTYTKDSDGEIYLSEIKYAGNNQVSPALGTTNSVKFILDTTDRTDHPPMFTTKKKVKTMDRLKWIEVYTANNTLVRKYRLDYDYSANSSRSLLTAVTQFDKNGVALPKYTSFAWQDNDGVVGQYKQQWVDPSPDIGWPWSEDGEGVHSGVQWFPGDINGDGRTDFIGAKMNNYTVTIITAIVNPNGNYANREWATTIPWPWIGLAQWFSGDVDGDGKADFMGVYEVPANSTYNYFHTKLVWAKGNGDGTFQSPVYKETGFGWPNEMDDYGFVRSSVHWFPGDMNGDGKTDFMGTVKAWPNGQYAYYHTYLCTAASQGSGAPTPYSVVESAVYWPHDGVVQWFSGDADGDGKADFMGAYPEAANGSVGYEHAMLVTALSNGNGTYRLAWQETYFGWPWAQDVYGAVRFFPGDANGDGKADFMGVQHTSPNGTYYYDHTTLMTAISNGRGEYDMGYPYGLETEFGWPWSMDYQQEARWFSSDANGDGMADFMGVVHQSSGNTTLMTAISKGNGTYTRYQYNTNFAWPRAELVHWFAGDPTGDGRSDFMGVSARGTTDTWLMIGQSQSPLDLIKTVSNPLGGHTDIEYTDSSVWTSCGADQWTVNNNTKAPFILHTVSRISSDSGTGAPVMSTRYEYSGACYNYGDREFRGFTKARSYHNADETELWATTQFLQDAVLKGKVATQVSTSYEGHAREVINDWAAQCIAQCSSQNAVPIYFPELLATAAVITDTTGGNLYMYQQQTAFGYDLQTLKPAWEYKYGFGTADDILTEYEYASSAKPNKVTVKGAGGVVAARKWIDYDTKYNLVAEEACKSDTPDTGCVNRNATQNPIVSYEYFSNGNLKKVTDPRGNQTSFTYDSATSTFPYEKTNALAHKTTTVYDSGCGKILTMIPPHLQGTGKSFSYTYDSFCRPVRETRPDTGWSEMNYAQALSGPASQYVQKQEHIVGGASALDHYTFTLYDGLGRTYRAQKTGPAGALITVDTFYDELGRVIQTTNPYFIGDPVYATTLTYDGMSRVTRTDFPDGAYTTAAYKGLTTEGVDQNGHMSMGTKDVFGRLAEARDHYDTVTQYFYDALGNLTTTVAAAGTSLENTTGMEYDSLSKKRSMNDPDMGIWQYSYDKAGDLTSQTDAKGQTITFDYDQLNRLSHKYYPNYTVAHAYDDPAITYAKGTLTKVSTSLTGNDHTEDATLALDVMQRVTQSRKTTGTNPYVTLSKAYDSAGRVFSITYPGKEVRYTYNAAGALTTVRDFTGSRDLAQYSSFTALLQPRTALSPRSGTYSVRTTYTYHPANARLAALLTEKLQSGIPVGSPYQNLSYEFDLKGNVQVITDTKAGTTHTYDYDALDRLTSVTGTGTDPYTKTYAYDAIGNITCKSDVGNPVDCSQPGASNYSYTSADKPHAVRSAGTGSVTTLGYDGNGNITSRQSSGKTLTLTWNYDNKPLTITKTPGSTASFLYDGNSQRVRKTYGSLTTLSYGELYEKRGSVGVIHVFAGNTRVASLRTDSQDQYYHPDHLGSASVITNGDGNIRETIEYYPFGTYRGTNQDPVANYTYTDQEDDDETGLYNYKARLYDPVLGRFVSPDSIVPEPGNLQAFNRYSYCVNNPLVYVDPSGQSFIDDFVTGLVGAVAFAASAVAIVGTGGTAAPVALALAEGTLGELAAAGAIAGAVSGGLGAALNGGNVLQGAAMGAAVGAVAGGTIGSVSGAGARQLTGVIMSATAAGGAYATGGLEGLAHFGAGLAGAMAGGYLTSQPWKDPIAGKMFADAGPKDKITMADAGYVPEQKPLWSAVAGGSFSLGAVRTAEGSVFMAFNTEGAFVCSSAGRGVGELNSTSVFGGVVDINAAKTANYNVSTFSYGATYSATSTRAFSGLTANLGVSLPGASVTGTFASSCKPLQFPVESLEHMVPLFGP